MEKALFPQQPFSVKFLLWAWTGVAVALTMPLVLLLSYHERFDYARELAQIPALWLAGGLVFAGIVYLALLALIERSVAIPKPTVRKLFMFVLAFGLVARVAMMWTTPALEDDFNRYMWDGAVTANGINPYSYAPASVGRPGVPARLTVLEDRSGLVHERVNHGQLKTVYPPLAQGAFALAYLIEPWSLGAWRLVCLAAEIATLALIVVLLGVLGRSPLWVALYWWNPVVIKEMINTAHMDAVLMPFVLAGLLASVCKRHLLAITMIGLGVGVKLWPIILAPLVLRPLLKEPRRLAIAVGVLGAMCAAWAIPPLLGGIDETSGFIAYATKWKTNSALSAVLAYFSDFALQPLGFSVATANRLLRVGAAVVLVGFVASQVAEPLRGSHDVIARATAIVVALFLLSPAQFPWYLVWVLPLMALRPVKAMLLASALLPIYYTSFHYYALGNYAVFKDQIVWLIWLPIWALLAWEIFGRRGRGQDHPSNPPPLDGEGLGVG